MIKLLLGFITTKQTVSGLWNNNFVNVQLSFNSVPERFCDIGSGTVGRHFTEPQNSVQPPTVHCNGNRFICNSLLRMRDVGIYFNLGGLSNVCIALQNIMSNTIWVIWLRWYILFYSILFYLLRILCGKAFFKFDYFCLFLRFYSTPEDCYTASKSDANCCVLVAVT